MGKQNTKHHKESNQMKFATVYTQKDERDHNWSTVNNEPTMTQKADASETNINVIMAKYNKTGQLPRVLAQPLFGDFSEELDYRTAVERINSAHDAFMEIPANIRQRFGNDPTEFMKFCADENNAEEMAKLGLTNPKPTPTIDQELLQAIKDLKPKETSNGK